MRDFHQILELAQDSASVCGAPSSLRLGARPRRRFAEIAGLGHWPGSILTRLTCLRRHEFNDPPGTFCAYKARSAAAAAPLGGNADVFQGTATGCGHAIALARLSFVTNGNRKATKAVKTNQARKPRTYSGELLH